MLLDIYYRAGRSDADLPVEKVGTTGLSTEYVDITLFYIHTAKAREPKSNVTPNSLHRLIHSAILQFYRWEYNFPRHKTATVLSNMNPSRFSRHVSRILALGLA
jgi:spore maturation protein CgeB